MSHQQDMEHFNVFPEIGYQNPITEQYQQDYEVLENENAMMQNQHGPLFYYGVPTHYPLNALCAWPYGTSQQHPYYNPIPANWDVQNQQKQFESPSIPYRITQESTYKRRPRYTPEQTQILQQRFAQSDRIQLKERRELAKIVNLTQHQIGVWFQNYRNKMRQEAEEKKMRKLIRKKKEAQNK